MPKKVFCGVKSISHPETRANENTFESHSRFQSEVLEHVLRRTLVT